MNREGALPQKPLIAASSSAQFPPLWPIVGALAFLPHLAAVIAAALQRPGFDHFRQFLSELSERGSTTGTVMNYGGIVPAGAMMTLFGLGLALHCRRERLILATGLLIAIHGLCRIATGLFPCDLGCRPAAASASQQIHNLAATAGFIALTTAAYTMGAYTLIKKVGSDLVIASYAAAVVASIALSAIGPGGSNFAGLYQRIALAALQAWTTYLALRLLRFGCGLLDVNPPQIQR